MGNEWMGEEKSKSVHSEDVRSTSILEKSRVQFYKDKIHLVVVQDIQISIYDASKLECLCHVRSCAHSLIP